MDEKKGMVVLRVSSVRVTELYKLWWQLATTCHLSLQRRGSSSSMRWVNVPLAKQAEESRRMTLSLGRLPQVSV